MKGRSEERRKGPQGEGNKRLESFSGNFPGRGDVQEEACYNLETEW